MAEFMENILQQIEKKFPKLTRFLAKIFLMQCKDHADLIQPAENRREQWRAWYPMAHVGNVHRFRNWNTILTPMSAATWDRVSHLYRL